MSQNFFIDLNGKKTHSQKLIYYKNTSNKRDACSLFFEYYDNKYVLINRTFFIREIFNNYLFNQNSLYPNVMNSSVLCDKEMFMKVLIDLPNLPEEVMERILNCFYEYSNGFVEVVNPNLIDDLNYIFYGLTFLKNSDCFYDNECVARVDEIFNIAFPNELNRYDRIGPKLPQQYLNIENLNLTYRVFDVGQANCSALLSKKINQDGKFDYDVVCVFDLGCQASCTKNPALLNMIKNISNDTTIVISHFDSDHINLVQNNFLNKTLRWIFTDQPPTSKKGFKLFQQLLAVATKKSCSKLIYSYNTPYSLSSFLRLEQKVDNNVGHYQSTIQNANSIISIIQTNKMNILIPGDALYHNFPNGVFLDVPYDLVLIPHHCCYYPDPSSTDSYVPIVQRIVGEYTLGIAMCGKNNHGHPNVHHLSWYKKHYLSSACPNVYAKKGQPIEQIPSHFGTNFLDFDI